MGLWITGAGVVVAGRVGGESRSVRADGYGGVVGQLRDLDGAAEGGPVKDLEGHRAHVHVGPAQGASLVRRDRRACRGGVGRPAGPFDGDGGPVVVLLLRGGNFGRQVGQGGPGRGEAFQYTLGGFAVEKAHQDAAPGEGDAGARGAGVKHGEVGLLGSAQSHEGVGDDRRRKACLRGADRCLAHDVLRSGWRWGAPVGAGCWGTGGWRCQPRKRPAEKLEADFRPRAAASWVGPQMPPEPRGRSASERQRAVAENGRARRAWSDADGPPSVMLGGLLTAYKGEGLRDPLAAGGGQGRAVRMPVRTSVAPRWPRARPTPPAAAAGR